MLIAYNTCMGFDFVEINGLWWLVDCFDNGLEDISLDVVAVEVWVWELIFSFVQWVRLSVAVWEYPWMIAAAIAASSARKIIFGCT
jgi:hypothetical protein